MTAALQMSVADYRAHVAATRAKFFPPARPVIMRAPPVAVPPLVIAAPDPVPVPVNENAQPAPRPVPAPVKVEVGARCPVGFASPEGTYPLRYLLALAAYVSGISVDLIQGERRSARIAKARQVYCWLAVTYGPEVSRSLPNVGRTIDRDHTTVLHAVRKVRAAVAMLQLAGNPREIAEQLCVLDWRA